MINAEIIQINVDKYIEALNNILGVDNAYFNGDKDVDAIVEVITHAKKMEDTINRLQAEINILIRKKDTLRDEIAEQQAEMERLREIEYMYNDLCI